MHTLRFPASLLSGGPAVRLLDLAIAAQESKGELILDDELRRYGRMVAGDPIAHWSCSSYAATGVLDLLAESIDVNAGTNHLPADFQEKLDRACDGIEPAEYLRILSEIMRTVDREVAADYEQLSMSGWEFLRTFPHLFGLDAILADEGDRDFSAVVREAVTNEHPYCQGLAVAYTTEAQRALMLFPGPDGLSGRLVWATRERLQALIDTIGEHMQRDHS